MIMLFIAIVAAVALGAWLLAIKEMDAL